MIGFRLFTEESLKLFIRYIISFVCFFRYLQFNSLFKTVVTVAFVLFLREGPGALHHGNEPLIIAGAGLPHDPPTHVAQTGAALRRPEEGHLPEQELPGFTPGPGPGADEEEEEESLYYSLRNWD